MIDFNIDSVRECAVKVREIAEQIELESENIQTISNKVNDGWIGTGAEEYKVYLTELKKKIMTRSENLRTIAGLLEYAADEAYWADRKAEELLEGNADSGGGANTPETSPVVPAGSDGKTTAEALANAFSPENVMNSFMSVLGKSNSGTKSHSGKGRNL